MSGPDDEAAGVWGNNNLVWLSMSEYVMCLDSSVVSDAYTYWWVGYLFSTQRLCLGQNLCVF